MYFLIWASLVLLYFKYLLPLTCQIPLSSIYIPKASTLSREVHEALLKSDHTQLYGFHPLLSDPINLLLGCAKHHHHTLEILRKRASQAAQQTISLQSRFFPLISHTFQQTLKMAKLLCQGKEEGQVLRADLQNLCPLLCSCDLSAPEVTIG